MTQPTFSYTFSTHQQTTCNSLLYCSSHKNCNIQVHFNCDIIKYTWCAHSRDHQALFPHIQIEDRIKLLEVELKNPLYVLPVYNAWIFYFHVCYTGGGPNTSGIRIFRVNEMEFRVLPLRYSELVYQVVMYSVLHVTSSGIIPKCSHVCLVIFLKIEMPLLKEQRVCV
jgi:hypothetical protein